VLEVSSVLGSQQSLADILTAITREIARCFQADQSSIMLTDSQANVIKTQASYATDDHPAKDAVLPLGKSIAGWVAAKGSPLLLHGDVKGEDYPGTPRKQQSIKSSMCVPLRIQDKVIGVLNVNRIEVEKRFSDKDLQLLGIFANNAAGAIYNAKLMQQIRNFNARLEEKVRQRTLELERANLAKSEFLAGMSHELRTPLNSINGFSQVLLKKHNGDLTPKQEEYTRYILESGQHLLSLINDILDIAKVEAGHFELETKVVSLHNVIASSLEMLKPQADQKSLALNFQWPRDLPKLTLKADERRLRQVMLNLMTNAVKFTPDEGTVSITVQQGDAIESLKNGLKGIPETMQQWATEAAGPYVAVSVSDTGIGLSLEDQKKIFEEFYQVNSGLRDKAPGTGLGLNLTQRLVEMHGGILWVYSEGSNRGSQFNFVLPIRN
jgi:signal transduction histidine kinase